VPRMNLRRASCFVLMAMSFRASDRGAAIQCDEPVCAL
jgi:hypothetical protein